jgi:addiction module RelE/StbE family toxin
MLLTWSSSFKRAFKKTVNTDPELKQKILNVMKQMEGDPFNPILRTHKLKGILDGCYASSIDYNYRIVFDFVKNPNSGETEILLIDIGTHDEVY